MKVSYDREVDAKVIRFSYAAIRDSDEIGPGVIVDFGHDGQVVGIEILSASRQMDDCKHVELTIIDPETMTPPD